MRPIGLLLVFGWMGSCALEAHDPITTKITFNREIVRLFQKRCLGCHQEGGKAPMSLLKYDEARPWAKAIKEEVLERRMPPWGAVKGFGVFQNEMALSQEEVSLIADWVEGGAPEGEAKYYPETVVPVAAKATPLKGARLVVNGSLQLGKALKLVGIEPKVKADVGSARVVAEAPDGGVEPLLWLKNYKAGWTRQFEFRKPLALAAGSKIKVEGATGVTFVLISQ